MMLDARPGGRDTVPRPHQNGRTHVGGFLVHPTRIGRGDSFVPSAQLPPLQVYRTEPLTHMIVGDSLEVAMAQGNAAIDNSGARHQNPWNRHIASGETGAIAASILAIGGREADRTGRET